MKRVLAHGEMSRGKLLVTDQKQLRADLSHMSDGPVEIIVRRPEDRHGIRQMQKYWHAVPVEICRQHFGQQHDPMHYELLGAFRGYAEGALGHAVPVVASSRKLGKEGWKQLIDWVLDWAPSEHQLAIPEPSTREARLLVDEYHRAGADEEAA